MKGKSNQSRKVASGQSKKRLGKVARTSRGFEIIQFKDLYDSECSLQMSSLAGNPNPGTTAVWLGVDDAEPQILAQHALRLGLDAGGETTGWVPYEKIPEEVSLTTRMHLDRKQVIALIATLQQWVDTGSFKKRRKA